MIDSDGSAHINTGGGAYVGDHLNVGGDFVGRDQITHVYHEDQRYDVAGLPNPFLGLEAFRYEDRAKFGGRGREISAAIARMTEPGQQQTLVFVIGASGSGKSSFAQAGLLPALEEHYQRQGKTTQCEVFKPANNPINRRDEKLAALNAHPNAVRLLVIDQFEELFTQSSKIQREAMFAWLIGLPPFEQSGLRVIATMRSDYLPDLLTQMTLHDIARQGIDLRQMRADELSEAIQAPVWAAYPDHIKQIEPALVERLAKDAGASAALLPLLQVTLQDLWKNGETKLARYGTLADAIQQRAEQVFAFEDFNEASPCKPRGAESQSAMMDTLLGLVRVDTSDDIRRDVRRARPLAALEQGRESLVDDLARARLLSVEKDEDSETVNIIHEALIANWKRLSDAIAMRREQLRKRERFEQQLKQWQDNGKSEQYLLLTDVQLGEARELDKLNDVVMRGAEARELLRSSAVAQEAERQRELDQARKLAEEQRLRVEQHAQANKRLRLRNIVLAITSIFALATTIWAMVNRNEAETQRINAVNEAVRSSSLKQAALVVANTTSGDKASQINELGLAKEYYELALRNFSTDLLTTEDRISIGNTFDIPLLDAGYLYNSLSEVCLEMDDLDCADNNSLKSLNIQPNAPAFLLQRAWVLIEKSDLENAQSYLEEADKFRDKDDIQWDFRIDNSKAQIAYLKKNWIEALKVLDAELSFMKMSQGVALNDPVFTPTILIGLHIAAQSYQKLGNKENACALYTDYLMSISMVSKRRLTTLESRRGQDVWNGFSELGCLY